MVKFVVRINGVKYTVTTPRALNLLLTMREIKIKKEIK